MHISILWPRVTQSISNWPNVSSAFLFKRARQRAIDYLEHEEIDAVLQTLNRTTVQGSRDYPLLATIFNTGGRRPGERGPARV
jgi:hypothetical protein